jgi:hypothetical protein
MLNPPRYLQNVLIGATAVLVVGARLVPHVNQPEPAFDNSVTLVSQRPDSSATADSTVRSSSRGKLASAALSALSNVVRPLSRPHALENAFTSYFAYKSAHPEDVKKPYLYFVDYGLPANTPRGYVFDMKSLKIVDGPFTVASGRGSKPDGQGIPTRFSNAAGSMATSLGLYLAKATYAFRGSSGGRHYSSVGLKLDGVSKGFNDKALARGVVAHGAPYVTPTKAGRSEGCPAMEQTRAERLLPKLADGGMVFLFAPDSRWLQSDPWLTSSAE